MPEGPEIALITRSLKLLKKSTLIKIALKSGKIKRTKQGSFTTFNKNLPANIKKISCKGKYIWFELENSGKIEYIGFRLGLVGRLRILNELHILPHDKVIFYFIKPVKYLIFSDYRNFGDVCLNTELQHNNYIGKIGPDIGKVSLKEFREKMKTSKKGNDMPLAHILLMQDLISGIGNYMRAEAIYDANISPHRKKSKMTDSDWKYIYIALKNVYKWAMSEQIKEVNYKKTNFKVYGKKNDPNGNTVIRENIKGRHLYWVQSINTEK